MKSRLTSFGIRPYGTVSLRINPSSDTKTVGVLDTGSSNVKAVMRSLSSSGFTRSLIPLDGPHLTHYDSVILPGVGNFGFVMGELERSGKAAWLRELHHAGTPILGICLGAQLLFDSSEEAPGVRGFGFIQGVVKRLPKHEDTRVPHMGWNEVWLENSEVFELQKLNGKSFYFAHSYHFTPERESELIAYVNQGETICAIAGSKSCLAIQFHPEKSGKSGQDALRRGLEWLFRVDSRNE